MRTAIIALALLVAGCNSDTTDPGHIDYPQLQITNVIAMDSVGHVLVTLRDTTTGLAGIWSAGQITLLPRPTTGVIDRVADMNDADVVTGMVRLDESGKIGTRRPFLWRPGDKTLEVLAPPSDGNYEVAAINNSETLVGVAIEAPTPDLVYHYPFVRPSGGAFQKLLVSFPSALQTWASARDVNESGQVAGSYSRSPGIHMNGFVWSNGVFTPVAGDTSVHGAETFPFAINAHGTVVGSSTEGIDGQQHVFIRSFSWQQQTGLAALSTPLANGCSRSINDKGEIVGEQGFPSRAFIWRPVSGTELIPVNGTASSAVAVNNRGQVLGWWDEPGIRHFYIWSSATGASEIGALDLGETPGGGYCAIY